MKILEARFKVSISREEYERSASPGAQRWAEMPGLRWKIYGFDDEGAMRAHMENLRKMEKSVDHASDLDMQVWDVQEALSKVTRGPI